MDPGTHEHPCRLRIVHINDVYELTALPRLATLIRSEAVGADRIIATIGGDFLAPSLLSSIDGGRAMVETLLQVGVQYACFGNHDNDIEYESLRARISEFEAGGGTWINSNLPDLLPTLPDHALVDIEGGGQRRSVALLGLLCDYPKLYRDGAFGGHGPPRLNANASACALADRLYAEGVCDLVIPLTHQDLADDQALIDTPGHRLPIVLGGHDHEPCCCEGSSGVVLKAGADAVQAVLVDVVWPSAASSEPEIHARLVDTAAYAPDAGVLKRVEHAHGMLRAMDSVVLYRHSPQLPMLSSVGHRLGEATLPTMLCTAVREDLSRDPDAPPVDCVLMQSGMIRAQQDYPSGRLTLKQIRAELPWNGNMVVVAMPGSVLADTLAYSRRKEGVKDSGSYLHGCDQLEVARGGRPILRVGGSAFDPDRPYQVALRRDLLVGLCGNKPLLDFAESILGEHIPPADAGVPVRESVLRHLIHQLWLALPPFDDIDLDGDGSLSFSEIKTAYLNVFGADANGDGVVTEDEQRAVDIVVEFLIAIPDDSADGLIHRDEYEWFMR